MSNHHNSSSESPFADTELLYSRTDPRGVIMSANSLFFRVAGFQAEELIGAPHRMVRHPDMPKGVFHLFWSRLKDGKAVGAFVKNRSKDGRYYWVYAVTRPVQNGYFSVRIKPGGPTFATVRNLYAELLEFEKGGRSPEASAEALVEALAGLGYRNYDAFMAASLREELAIKPWARSDQFIVKDSLTLRDQLTRLTEDRAQFFSYLKDMQLLPTNLRILSAQLGSSAGAIREISTSYMAAMQEVIKDAGNTDANGNDDAMTLLESAIFEVGSARVQAQCLQHFQRQDAELHSSDQGNEVQLFQSLAEAAQRTARANLFDLSRLARRIEGQSEDLGRQMFGLEQIRLLGDIESGRGHLAGTALKSMMGELENAHKSIRTVVSAMNDYATDIRDLAARASQSAA